MIHKNHADEITKAPVKKKRLDLPSPAQFATNQPRVNLPEHVRTALERATHGNELLFTELREEVRRSATFCALPDADQITIERTLF